MARIDKNKALEAAKKAIAVKHGYKSWNELRGNVRLQDAFLYLHEAATNAIEDLQRQ